MVDKTIDTLDALPGALSVTSKFIVAESGSDVLKRATGQQVKDFVGGGTAAATAFTPAGSITASNVQMAIEELDAEKLPKLGGVLVGGTRTSAGSTLTISETLNNAAVAFPGALVIDQTNTASAAGSLIADFRSSGVSKFGVTVDGRVYSGMGYTYGKPQFFVTQFGDGTGFGLQHSGTAVVYVQGNPIASFQNGSNGFRLAETTPITWCVGSAISSTPDLLLYRDAANVLAQRNGTNAQGFRVYNTYTSLSNRENFAVSWSGNTCTVGTETSGATLRPLVISGSTISASAPFLPKQCTTATRPSWLNGATVFDTDIDKLLIGGATGWEVVTSA